MSVGMRILIPVALLAACRSGPPTPVDIDASDMCAQCRMAISERRYAAEIIDQEGAVRKFDDLACLLRYRREHHPQTAAVYVMDFERRAWLAAEQAYYVRSEKFVTPMSGGIIALADSATAERQAGRYGSAVIRFADLGQH